MFNSKAMSSLDSVAGSGKRASAGQKQFAVLWTSNTIIEFSLRLFGLDYDREKRPESELAGICQAYHQLFDKLGFRYDRWSVAADSVVESSDGRRTPAAENCEHTPSTPSMTTRRKSTRNQATPSQAAAERRPNESIGRRETRRYQYLSEDESSGAEESFRKSPRAKRSLGHQATKENPAKKAKVNSNHNNSEADHGRKTSSPSTSILTTVLDHSPIKAIEPAVQKTPQPVGKNSKKRKLPPESVKKSGKVLTRQRAAAKRAINAIQGTVAAEQAKTGPTTSAFPASHTPGKTQLVSQSITKKYKKYQKIQTKKLLQVKLKINNRRERESETQDITPPLMLDETLTASPNTSRYLECPNLRIRVAYRNDFEREICQHVLERQACIVLHKLPETDNNMPDKNEKPSKTKAKQQKAVSQAKLAANKGRKETMTSPKSSKENEKSRKSDQSKATHASSNVLKANNANQAAADFITPRLKRVAAAAAAATVTMDDTYCDYPVTPFQPGKLLDEDNYDVSELHDSMDSECSDSEREPKKPIPSWAREPRLEESIKKQVYHFVPFSTIFSSMRNTIALDEVFAKSKKNYLARSSSAIWETTPHKEADTSRSGRPK